MEQRNTAVLPNHPQADTMLAIGPSLGGPVFFDNLVWLTSKEAAEYLRKSAGALRIHVHRGHIRCQKWRNRLYFRRVDLDRMLMSPSQGGSNGH